MLDVADPALLPGELLAGKYRIERVLGRGGMGIVLGARNVLLGKRVAVKLVTGGAGGVATPRLLMEARATARLESDHAVRIFDVGHTERGDPYLVMEQLEGQSLAELLREAAPIPPERVVFWVLQACEALAEAHAQGIVHRDVKPANLFLEQRPDGSRRVKVLDFGIARLPASERLATTTHAIGSPVYMAPEQLANCEDIDLRADVWGIGCVLYELLTGAAPFEASSVLELASKIARGSPGPLCALRPELPEQLSLIVERCLQAERARRWRDLLQLGRALLPFAPAEAKPLLDRIERLQASGGEPGGALPSLDPDATTRDLPSAELARAPTELAGPHPSAEMLRDSAPALTNSLRESGSAPPSRARGGGRALVAALAVLSAVTLLSALQRAPRAPSAAPAAQDRAAQAHSSGLSRDSAMGAHVDSAAAPTPRVALASRSAAPALKSPARAAPVTDRAPELSPRRALPRPARQNTKNTPRAAVEGPRAEGSAAARRRGEPLPLDREAPW